MAVGVKIGSKTVSDILKKKALNKAKEEYRKQHLINKVNTNKYKSAIAEANKGYENTKDLIRKDFTNNVNQNAKNLNQIQANRAASNVASANNVKATANSLTNKFGNNQSVQDKIKSILQIQSNSNNIKNDNEFGSKINTQQDQFLDARNRRNANLLDAKQTYQTAVNDARAGLDTLLSGLNKKMELHSQITGKSGTKKVINKFKKIAKLSGKTYSHKKPLYK